MIERSVEGLSLCVANRDGHYAALDNRCPHRGAPLAEGTLEGGKVICPLHAWAFDLHTGKADDESSTGVRVYALRVTEDAVEIEVDPV